MHCMMPARRDLGPTGFIWPTSGPIFLQSLFIHGMLRSMLNYYGTSNQQLLKKRSAKQINCIRNPTGPFIWPYSWYCHVILRNSSVNLCYDLKAHDDHDDEYDDDDRISVISVIISHFYTLDMLCSLSHPLSIPLCFSHTPLYLCDPKQWFLTFVTQVFFNCNSQKPSPSALLAGVSGSCSSKKPE